MIYILGMSHIRPVLDACSINGIDEQLSKIANDKAPEFADWNMKPGLLPAPVKAASIYIRQIGAHWGLVPAQLTGPQVIGVVPGFQSFLESIDSTGHGTVLIAFMYGEEYIQMSKRPYNAPHDFQVPWRPDLVLAPQRQIIPLEIVERQVALHLTKSIANFEAIRCFHPHLRIINAICPPPGECGDGGEPGQRFQSLKYYLLYVNALQAAAARRGIETLLPPAETLTSDGLLRAEYMDDGVHGNKLYGGQVVAQINDLLLQGAH
jgi:hypothetical protein